MIAFENKNVSVSTLHTFVPTEIGMIAGDCVYVDSTPNKDKKFNVPMGGIWVQDLGDFQNKDNFIQGIKYVSELANPKARTFCFELLDLMTDNFDKKANEAYCRLLSFFCELGVWKNKKIRSEQDYHKDFPKYFSNIYKLYAPYFKL